MADTFQMPIKKIVKSFKLFHFSIVLPNRLLRGRLVCPTYWIPQSGFSFISFQCFKSDDFQSKSILLITENCLPFTDEVTVEVVHKCLQTSAPACIRHRYELCSLVIPSFVLKTYLVHRNAC